MTFIYLAHGGPNGEIARVQGSAYDPTYLATYRRWPGCYAVLWQPTGTILAEGRTEKRTGWLMETIYRQCQLDKHAPALADIEGGIAALIQGWRNIYPDETPAKPRRLPTRAGWDQVPYRVTAHGYPDGAWEVGGYTRGITGAVEVRSEYGSGSTIDLTHLPTGFLYGHADCWPLATVLADVMATALPTGTFGVVPPTEALQAAHEAVLAARQEYADQITAQAQAA